MGHGRDGGLVAQPGDGLRVAVEDRDTGPLEQAGELVVVALLGGTEEPVHGVDGLRQLDAAGDVLAPDGARGLKEEPVLGVQA